MLEKSKQFANHLPFQFWIVFIAVVFLLILFKFSSNSFTGYKQSPFAAASYDPCSAFIPYLSCVTDSSGKPRIVTIDGINYTCEVEEDDYGEEQCVRGVPILGGSTTVSSPEPLITPITVLEEPVVVVYDPCSAFIPLSCVTDSSGQPRIVTIDGINYTCEVEENDYGEEECVRGVPTSGGSTTVSSPLMATFSVGSFSLGLVPATNSCPAPFSYHSCEELYEGTLADSNYPLCEDFTDNLGVLHTCYPVEESGILLDCI